jgi:hypothetical protein
MPTTPNVRKEKGSKFDFLQPIRPVLNKSSQSSLSIHSMRAKNMMPQTKLVSVDVPPKQPMLKPLGAFFKQPTKNSGNLT